MSEKSNQSLQHLQDTFPPKIAWWQWLILIISYIIGALALLYLVDQFCRWVLPPNECLTYIALSIVLSILLIDRFIWHKSLVHKSRLVDQSLVEAMFVDADTVKPRLEKPSKKPAYYEQKEKEIKKEVERLKGKGNHTWTEYQVLSLNQMLIDFMSVDDLIANARQSLAELEEYAEDSAYRYDRDSFHERKQRIEEAIEEIYEVTEGSKGERDVAKDESAEKLRAELRTLLEHVADYNQNWSMGSVLVRSLTVLGVLSIPILIVMGLLPFLHPSENTNGVLSIFNWGLLGISGSITAMLLSLRKSDLVEVGNTEGRKELRNAILGTALGLVAGILAFAMISGKLFATGSAIPNLESKELKDIGLSIIWAVASGFSFERIFDRMRSTTVGDS